MTHVSSSHMKGMLDDSLVPAHSGKLLYTLLVLSLGTKTHISPCHLIRARGRGRGRSYLGDLIRDEFG